jgi:hypothetical protein
MNVILVEVYFILLLLMPITGMIMRLGWGERSDALIGKQRRQDLICYLIVGALTGAAIYGFFLAWGMGVCVAGGFCFHRSRLPLLVGKHPRRFWLSPLGLALSAATFIPIFYFAKTTDPKAGIKQNEKLTQDVMYRVVEDMKKSPLPFGPIPSAYFSETAPYKVFIRKAITWDKKPTFYVEAVPRRYGKQNQTRFVLLEPLKALMNTGVQSYVLEASGILLTKDTQGKVIASREELKLWAILQTRKKGG